MVDLIRPVRLGILIGLLGVIFGIAWASYLVLGHERIHSALEARAMVAEKSKEGEVSGTAPGHHAEAQSNEAVSHSHKDGGHNNKEAGAQGGDHGVHEGHSMGAHDNLMHDNPMMELAHTRLVRGHLHAMGLGLATIVSSLVIAFTSMPAIIKTAVSVLTGLGGLIYPLAWIAMGYRTPLLGPEMAESSVATIAGAGAALVLIGVLTAAGFTLKDIFSKRR